MTFSDIEKNQPYFENTHITNLVRQVESRPDVKKAPRPGHKRDILGYRQIEGVNMSIPDFNEKPNDQELQNYMVKYFFPNFKFNNPPPEFFRKNSIISSNKEFSKREVRKEIKPQPTKILLNKKLYQNEYKNIPLTMNKSKYSYLLISRKS